MHTQTLVSVFDLDPSAKEWNNKTDSGLQIIRCKLCYAELTLESAVVLITLQLGLAFIMRSRVSSGVWGKCMNIVKDLVLNILSD